MKLYGHMPNGEDVFQVTIESSDLQLKVLSLGAIIQDIRMRNVTHSLYWDIQDWNLILAI